MKPKPIVNEALVAEKIRLDYRNGLIMNKDILIQRILLHDQFFSKISGTESAYQKGSIPKSTFSRFLSRFELPTIQQHLQDRRKKKHAMNQETDMKNAELHSNNQVNDDDDDGVSIASTRVPISVTKRISSSSSHSNVIDQILMNPSEVSDDEEGFIQPTPRLVSSEKKLLEERDRKKIEKLTEMYTSLSNKIAPSPLLTSADSELEGKRILHLCIRSLIQSLASIESVLQWIVENINIGDTQNNQDDEQLLPNSWFWNTVLKYEAANDKVSELKNFETN
jgi:hypothetical protein